MTRVYVFHHPRTEEAPVLRETLHAYIPAERNLVRFKIYLVQGLRLTYDVPNQRFFFQHPEPFYFDREQDPF